MSLTGRILALLLLAVGCRDAGPPGGYYVHDPAKEAQERAARREQQKVERQQAERECTRLIAAFRGERDKIRKTRLLDEMTPACQSRSRAKKTEKTKTGAVAAETGATPPRPGAPAEGDAEDPPDQPAAPGRVVRGRRLCFVTYPRPACLGSMSIDLTGAIGTYRQTGLRLTFLKNMSPRYSVGLSFGGIFRPIDELPIGERESNGAFTVQARYRHWLVPEVRPLGGVAADLSIGGYAGSHVTGSPFDDTYRSTTHWGPIAEGAIGLGDIIAVSVAVHTWRRWRDSRLDVETTIGLRVGVGWLWEGVARYAGWIGHVPSLKGGGPMR